MRSSFKQRLQGKYRGQVKTAQITLYVITFFSAIYLVIFFINMKDFYVPGLTYVFASVPTIIILALAIWASNSPKPAFLVAVIFLILLTVLSLVSFSIISILLYGVGASIIWKGREAAKELEKEEASHGSDDILDSGVFWFTIVLWINISSPNFEWWILNFESTKNTFINNSFFKHYENAIPSSIGRFKIHHSKFKIGDHLRIYSQSKTINKWKPFTYLHLAFF